MKVILFVTGFFLVALGLGLVIKNWDILAAMVKAGAGVLIALAGLVMMFAASMRR
jgi:hypothetical protein